MKNTAAGIFLSQVPGQTTTQLKILNLLDSMSNMWAQVYDI